jgi:energy-coupling factor transporter ATP-binding protein EcfA2
MTQKFSVLQNGPDEAMPVLYFPDGSRYRPSHDSSFCYQKEKEKVVVTGAFPVHQGESPVLVETIRDPKNPERLMFLMWENGKPTVVPQIEREGKIFVPPDPTSGSFPLLSLPNGLGTCCGVSELLAELASTISKFVKLFYKQSLIVATFVLTSWFPDCLEAAPYLSVVGPTGSGKTKLLKLLRCLCRRSLMAGDLRSGSLYKLTDAWGPTLIIDELDAPDPELMRILRTGSVPGFPTYRNGQGYSTYGLKIISSRQPPGDAAWSSRALVVSLLPTEEETLPLDDVAMRQIQNEFQSKLCMFRLKNHMAVKNFRVPPNALQGLSGRMRQIARALCAPLLGDEERTSELLAILGEYDLEILLERALEPEWLVAETLFDLCHEGMGTSRILWEILVGEIAYDVNHKLEKHGEDLRLSAKKVGLVLRSLGIHTVRLGRRGRGLNLNSGLKRKIHGLARQLGIDRRWIAMSHALEGGYGGVPCELCEEFGVTGGLRFVEINKIPLRKLRPMPGAPSA